MPHMQGNSPKASVRWSALIALLSLVGCQTASADFPAVDSTKLRITLQRSACFGTCPDYKVVIDGGGNVTFTTMTRPSDPVSGIHRRFAPSIGVVVSGTHHARIEPAQVTALLDRARAVHFFGLKPEYRAG